MPPLQFAALTDTGRQRSHNEDAIAVDEALGLFLLADGMGGHAAGEVASRLAVETIGDKVAQGESLVTAIEVAHRMILDSVARGEGSHGMGTTVVAARLQGCDYEIAWVGDSRAYLWNGELAQISHDHSLVQMLLDSGQIDEAEAQVHPRRNIIYQNLGAEEQEVLQVSQLQGCLYRGEKLLLCSDGLNDELDSAQISELFAQHNEVQALAQALVDTANDSGGSDNISVIVISAPENAENRPAEPAADDEANRDTLVPE